jgi:hypothetical protein
VRLHEWIAFEEGYFPEQHLGPDVMWDVYLGHQMKGWTGGSGGPRISPAFRSRSD